MEPATVLVWGGPILHAGAWLLIRAGRSIWVVTAAVLGPLGLLVLLLGEVRAAERVGTGGAAAIGVLAGAALYGATAAFMYLARRWSLLARHAGSLYASRAGVPIGAAVVLAALVVAPGEELLWRGLVQERLGALWGQWTGALVAWGAYLVVNAASGSLPIVLGAAVGGATWAVLAVTTGGVIAAILCHAVWTALMVLRPPVFDEGAAP